MRKSIATVSVSGTLPEKLAAIAQARFHGVEIFESDLVNSPFPPERIRWQAADLGLAIELYQPFRDFEAMPPDRFAASLKRAERKFDVMERLGAETMLVCSNVSPDAIGDDALAAEHLHALAERAAARGLMIAYEALAWGRHVREYQHSWEIVRAAGHPALGVCLDSFHILSRGSDPAGIRRVPGEKIFFLQLADAPVLAMDVLQWSRHHRCFPGQGGFDLTGFVGHVLAAGYRGPLSLEVFSDTFRQAEPESTALDAMRSLLYLEESLRVRLEHGGGRASGIRGSASPGRSTCSRRLPLPSGLPRGTARSGPVRPGLRGDRRGGGGRAGPGRHAARAGLHPGRRAPDQERHLVAARCGVPRPEHRPGRARPAGPGRIPARPAADRAGPAHHRQRRSRRPGRAVPRTGPAAPAGQR